ncbi:hypothetical protein BCAR13_60205 [Paraburkholderia caribensis]|nr:hypothetical protein BCAR13_60205 [Paraburkholderia caribensis]
MTRDVHLFTLLRLLNIAIRGRDFCFAIRSILPGESLTTRLHGIENGYNAHGFHGRASKLIDLRFFMPNG